MGTCRFDGYMPMKPVRFLQRATISDNGNFPVKKYPLQLYHLLLLGEPEPIAFKSLSSSFILEQGYHRVYLCFLLVSISQTLWRVFPAEVFGRIFRLKIHITSRLHNFHRVTQNLPPLCGSGMDLPPNTREQPPENICKAFTILTISVCWIRI